MESGANKSLFTLLAIIVFGIFLALSYFMFQDKLKGVLASVTDKTELRIDNRLDAVLNQSTVLTALQLKQFNPNNETITILDATQNGYTYSSRSKVVSGIGYYIQPSMLEAGKNYVLTYDIQKNGGNIYKLGGHSTISSSTAVYMDGTQVYTYGSGFGYPNDNAVHHIEVRFNTSGLTSAKIAANDLVDGIHIQPNRDYSGLGSRDYEVTVSNVKLVKQ